MTNALHSLSSTDFVNIFALAAIILIIQTTVRFMTKLPIICNDPPNAAAKREAQFECFRLGIDLSIMGLVTGVAVFEVAMKFVEQNNADAMGAQLAAFMLVQFLLILLAAVSTTIYRSPVKQFHLGIWIPSLIGVISLYVSAAEYFTLGK